mmetsp:Transcript_19112/g.41102  ORF Transcript_19112/g.41102 Transcript_19112/m.41102 type:complete len:360 (+) Transcript_19112:92-1171(+)
MLNSSYGDEFAPNPFRGGQQQQQQQTSQDGFYNAGPSAINVNDVNQPDPFSGMTGTMDLPESPPQQQQPRQPQFQQQQSQQQMPPPTPPGQDPASWSGTMDQRASTTENYGGTTTTTTQPGAAPQSIFGWRSCLACFRLESYFQYFDMETTDITARLKASLLQFHLPDQFRTAVVGDVATDTLKGPDLYGPVWVSFTLIFLVAVTSNIHAYWTHERKVKNTSADDAANIDEFEMDIQRLLHASTIVCFFCFGVPTVFWLATNCLGMPDISWGMWICCYGYCQVPYLPATILIAVLPFELVSWPALGAATTMSVLLILRNLSTPLLAQDSASHAKAAPFILAILAAHAIYFLVVKIVFFP